MKCQKAQATASAIADTTPGRLWAHGVSDYGIARVACVCTAVQERKGGPSPAFS